MTAPIPFNANALCMSIAATTAASASVALPASGSTVRITNEGPNTAYVSIGVGAQVATLPTAVAAATCTPVLAGEDASFTISNSAIQNISAICRIGTATLDVQVGEGQ